jgi:MFS family permease
MRAFHTFIATQTLSLVGSRMTSIALGLYVTVETGQASPLLLVAFFNELPSMLLGSAAGVWVDRWDRRWVMLWADVGQAVGSLLLLITFLSGGFQLWQLYAVVLWQGICAMFQGPAQDAAVSALVPEFQLDRANALRQMAFPLASILAAGVTGILYPLIGIAGIVLVDMCTFLVAVLALFYLHIPRPVESSIAGKGDPFWQAFRAAWDFLRHQRGLWLLLLYMTLLNFLLNGSLELTIPYLLLISGSEGTTGWVLAAMQAGALLGGLAVGLRRTGWSRVLLMLSAFLLTGVMYLLYGGSREPFALALSLFLLMIPLPLGWGLFTSLLQVKTPPAMQGRVFGLMQQMGYLASTASFFLTAYLVDGVLEPASVVPGAGIGWLLQATGALILVLTGAVLLIPAVRHLEHTLPNTQEVAQ